jgi:Flp pilus assembly protein TadG
VKREQGQATVELALLLPLLVLLTLGLVQLGLLAHDRVALTHAAREAVRTAVVDPSPDAVHAAAVRASSLDASRLSTRVGGGGDGGDVTVVVTYRAPIDVPVVSSLVGDVTLTERFVGQSEP